MTLRYVNLTELNNFLGTSGIDSTVTDIGESAEALLDTLIGTVGLEQRTGITEYFKPGYSPVYDEEGSVFYLKNTPITDVTKVNGVDPGTINTDFIVEVNRIELKTPVSPTNTFPYRYTIEYTAGYTTIPEDVKLAVNTLASAIYSTKSSQGVASFRQDLLSVNYKAESILDTIGDPGKKGLVQAVINKYRVNIVLS